jgi:hypothetical protein
MKTDRPHSHRTPLSAEELAMLHKLSEESGMSAADVLRQYIRKQYLELQERELRLAKEKRMAERGGAK